MRNLRPPSCLFACIGLAAVLWSAPAVGEEPGGAETKSQRATLAYERTGAASTCPDAEAIRGRVAARLGYDPFVDDSETRVHVDIDELTDRPGFVGRIEIRRPDQEAPDHRRLTVGDETCGELAEAIVFAVSVAIDPSAAMAPDGSDRPSSPAVLQRARSRRRKATAIARSALRRAEERTQQEHSEQPAPPDQKAARQKPSPQSSTESEGKSLEVRGLAGGGLAFGAAPNLAASLRMGAELGGPSFGVVVGGRVDMPTIEQVEGGSFRTLLTVGEVAPCGRFSPVFVCGLFQFGALRLTGAELPDSASHSVVYSAAGSRAGLELDMWRRLGLRFYGELLATLAQTNAIVGDRVVWQTPPVSGTIGLSVTFQFL